MIQGRSRKIALAVLAIAACLPAGLTFAATFNTSTSTRLEFLTLIEVPLVGDAITQDTKPDGLMVNGVAAFTEKTLVIEGNGTASTSVTGDSGPLSFSPLSVGDALIQSTSATGAAPSDSFAQSEIIGEGSIQLTNGVANGSTFVIPLKFTSNYTINAVEDFGGDFASAETSFRVESNIRGVLFTITDHLNTEGSLDLITDNDLFVLAVVLAPGQTETISVFTNSSGFATSEIPEPTTATVLGLMGLALLSRRRSSFTGR